MEHSKPQYMLAILLYIYFFHFLIKTRVSVTQSCFFPAARGIGDAFGT